MKKVEIQGHQILVDDDVFDNVDWARWRVYKTTTNTLRVQKRQKNKTILLHRLILNASERQVIDHIDGNALNNLRSNLRFCSIAENCRNVGIRSDNISGFKGVALEKRSNRWRVQVSVFGRIRTIGRYRSIIDAAIAYDDMAIKSYGDFAWLNFKTLRARKKAMLNEFQNLSPG